VTELRTIYVSIGNSDDKLSQSLWASYTLHVMEAVRLMARQVYGEWYSLPSSIYQNACVGFRLEAERVIALQGKLTELRERYGQDSLAWAEVEGTVML
jgi:hypothetical protein